MLLTFPHLLEVFKVRYKQIIAVGALIFVSLIFFLAVQGSPSVEKNWIRVQKSDFIIDLVESGEIHAVESEYVTAPREWRMELQIIDLAPEGSMVEKGDFLVKFDTSTLEEELDKEKDKLKEAEAELMSIDAKQA